MIKTISFKPIVTLFNSIDGIETTERIESEPMIYSGSLSWTRENCGPITRSILDSIIEDVNREIPWHEERGYFPVIDTKSVQLMPGMYPCIPGWHCDGVIRADGNSQPNIDTIKHNIMNYTCIVGTPGAIGTEFIDDISVTIPVDTNDVWSSVDKTLKENISVFDTFVSSLGQIIKFNRAALHNGTVATHRCWRYFFRLSFSNLEPQNRIRNQVQVYSDFSKGW